MTGHSLTLVRQIAARPERVWEVITDLDNAADTIRAISSITRLTDGPFTVGTRWRETRRMFGKEETVEMWVSEISQGEQYVVRAAQGGVDYTSIFAVTPDGNGSRLSVFFGADQPDAGLRHKAMWVLFGRIGLAATRKGLKADLDDIAGAAEAS